jgi:hypothetical protein
MSHSSSGVAEVALKPLRRGMTITFPVTITTVEELRLLEQEERARFLPQGDSMTAVFDEFDCIRAHGLSVKPERD